MVRLERAPFNGSLMLLFLVLTGVSHRSLALDVESSKAPSREARLHPRGWVRYGTGHSVPDVAFGSPLVVRGEPDGSALAFVGAPGDDEQRGAIYVYRRDTSSDWHWVQTLLPDDAPDEWIHVEDIREFGASLALDGDRLLAGAPLHLRQHGAVYLFERDDSGRWLPAGRLTPDYDPKETGSFGVSVALDGDRALVGSHNDDGGQGAVYVFERGGAGHWRQVQRIASHHDAPPDRFGYPTHVRFGISVALDGDVAVIGAESADRGHGAATLFTRGRKSSFEIATQLRPERPTGGFGSSLALEGDTLVVGAWLDDSAGGAVYVFERTDDEWTLAQRLTPTDGQPDNGFGRALSLDGDRLAVGAPIASDRACIFSRDSVRWREQLILPVPAPGRRPVFGRAVALSGQTLLVGDTGDTTRCPTSDDCYTRAAHAYRIQEAVPPARLTAVHGQVLVFTPGEFGELVLAFDDLALVGDPGADDACPLDLDCNSGAIHILEPGAGGHWVETQRIAPRDLSSGARFGGGAARDGDWLVVSAQGSYSGCATDADCGTSAVYIFHLTDSGGWSLSQRIPSPFDEPGFGTGLALRGGLLLVGRSHRGFVEPERQGAVHVFTLDEMSETWIETTSIRARSIWGDSPVSALAIDGDQVLIHSEASADGTVGPSIAVYALEAGIWSEIQVIADIELAVPYFAVDDGLMAVRRLSGVFVEVRMHRRDADGVWREEQTLAKPAGAGDGFGTSLSVENAMVFIGAPPADSDSSGAAYLFARDTSGTWSHAQTTESDEPAETGRFGSSVSFGGRTAIVGSPGVVTDPATLPGRVSFYRLLDTQAYFPVVHNR